MSSHRLDTLTPPTGTPQLPPAPSETHLPPTSRRDLRQQHRQDQRSRRRAGWLRRGRLFKPLAVTAAVATVSVGGTLFLTNGGFALNSGTSNLTNVSTPLATGYPATGHGRHKGHRGRHHPPAASTTPTTSTTAPTTTAPATEPPTTTPPVVTPSGFPNASNTGVQSGVSLKDHSGTLTVTAAGSTVSDLDISGGLIIRANDVTVKNVKVRCSGVSDFCVQMDGTGDVLTNSEVGGGSTGTTLTGAIGIWAGGDRGNTTSTQIVSTNVHHTSDGLRIDGYTTVRDSYIHDLSYSNGVHSDGSQTTSGPSIVYRHNTLVGGTNCTIFLQPTGDQPISNVVIDQNMMIGEARNGQITSYGLCVDPRVSNVSVTNNRFSRTGWQVAPASQNFPWAAWSNNAYADGAALSKP